VKFQVICTTEVVKLRFSSLREVFLGWFTALRPSTATTNKMREKEYSSSGNTWYRNGFFAVLRTSLAFMFIYYGSEAFEETKSGNIFTDDQPRQFRAEVEQINYRKAEHVTDTILHRVINYFGPVICLI
jgi:hypothetical protein